MIASLWVVIPKADPRDSNRFQELYDWGLDPQHKAVFYCNNNNCWQKIIWNEQLKTPQSDIQIVVMNPLKIEKEPFPEGFFNSVELKGLFLHYDGLSGLGEYKLDRLAAKWILKREKMGLQMLHLDGMVPIPLSSTELPWSKDIITFRESLATSSNKISAPDLKALERAYQNGKNHIFKEFLFRDALQVFFPLYVDLISLTAKATSAEAIRMPDLQYAIEAGKSAYNEIPKVEKDYLDTIDELEGQPDDIQSRFVQLRKAFENLTGDSNSTHDQFIKAFKKFASLMQIYTVKR